MKPVARHALCAASGSAVLVVIALTVPRPIFGCATAFQIAKAKENVVVKIATESAIIVWDAANQVQHFIRNASFETKGAGADFGFLVPTPTQPTLAEADHGAFATLAEVLQPPRKEAIWWEFTPLICLLQSTLSSRDRGEKDLLTVRVLHTQRVAGYDAVVLEAENGKDLNEWLDKNGYESRPALVDWLDQYAKLKWKITAFKIAETAPAGAVPTGHYRKVPSATVRMSFKTPTPFFPYREPADASPPVPEWEMYRTMQVFFIGTARMAGRLGESTGQLWPAKTLWSNRVPDGARATLARQLGVDPGLLTAGSWLTTFEDSTYRRPDGKDLFFVPSEDQTPIVPATVTVYTREINIPADVVVFSLIVGAIAFKRWREVRAARLAR